MKLININTKLGNKILEDLKNDGWKKTKEYSILAFDKGIDYDSYTIKKNKLKLEFEWTNWLEWEISGSHSELNFLTKQYNLKTNQQVVT
ncbi:MAG: hypothetical protein ACRBCI_01970 [Cellvibrionaceae bacterium]